METRDIIHDISRISRRKYKRGEEGARPFRFLTGRGLHVSLRDTLHDCSRSMPINMAFAIIKFLRR